MSDDVTDQGRDLTGDDWQAITVALVARLLPHGGEVCIVPEDFVAVAGKVLSVTFPNARMPPPFTFAELEFSPMVVLSKPPEASLTLLA